MKSKDLEKPPMKTGPEVLLNKDHEGNNQIQRLTVDMPSDLHKEFKIWCVTHNLKMNELVRDLIRETIKA